jgi:hypothetical protein
MRSISLALCLCACTGAPPALEVSLTDARARPNGSDWLVTLEVELDNASGAPIATQTHFASALDGTSLALIAPDGRVIHTQSYVTHQSPYAEDREVLVPMGRSTQRIAFPISIAPPPGARARLIGAIAGRPDLEVRTEDRLLALE